MSPELLDLLRRVDTPTVCNAIEAVQGRRGFAAYTRGTMQASHPTAPAMVGYACTARIAAAAPPKDPPDVVRARRLEYYRTIAEAPRPAVAVIEDEDYPDSVGAFWGEISTNVHRGFGVSGGLTNGSVRDLGDLPDGFPVVAGSIGPSHAFVHVTAVGVPVTVLGLAVSPGDLVHADRHGAAVIPPDTVDGLAEAIAELRRSEHLIIDPARLPGFDFAAFEAAFEAFEKARR